MIRDLGICHESQPLRNFFQRLELHSLVQLTPCGRDSAAERRAVTEQAVRLRFANGDQRMDSTWWPTAHQIAGSISQLQRLVGASAAIGTRQRTRLIRRIQASVCDEVTVVGLRAECHGVRVAPARKPVPVPVVGQPPSEHREFSGRAGECVPGNGVECTGFQPILGVRQLVDGNVDQLRSAGALILLIECVDSSQKPLDVTHADPAPAFGQKDRYCPGRSQLAELTPFHLVLDFPRSSPEIIRPRRLVCVRHHIAAEYRMPVLGCGCVRQCGPEPFELAGVEPPKLLVQRRRGLAYDRAIGPCLPFPFLDGLDVEPERLGKLLLRNPQSGNAQSSNLGSRPFVDDDHCHPPLARACDGPYGKSTASV
nr:hypothetical protein [Nocardia asiatica]